MKTAAKKKSYRVRGCYCVQEREGRHVYKWCYRTKNKASAAMKLMRKRYPASKLAVRADTCFQRDLRRHSKKVW